MRINVTHRFEIGDRVEIETGHGKRFVQITGFQKQNQLWFIEYMLDGVPMLSPVTLVRSERTITCEVKTKRVS
jgi:hypothetical protein